MHFFLKEKADIGPCMDIKAHNGLLYAIQRDGQFSSGRLCVLRHDLTPIAEYCGIGNARQIEIIGNTAVITAREDGLWLFDISLLTPKLLCHYRTVEYATGVALYGNLALVSCRQYGVQIIDISDPCNPLHLSFVRIGEIQSATVSDGILYGGAWGEMKVVVVDIHDPAAPAVLAEIPLQGRGDGVHVKDGILYAATGQHARGLINSTDHNDPCFGMGNGVQAFDVRDPKHPVHLKSALFDKGYCRSVDMWEPAIYGDTLVVNNSILGVWGLDPTTLEVKWKLSTTPIADNEDPVTGVTSLNGDLFVTTAYGGLFVHRGLGIGEQVKNESSPILPAKPQPATYQCETGNGTLAVRYSGSFPVLSIAETADCLVLACCEGGVHLLHKDDLSLLATIPTAGQAQDVKIHGNTLFVAEEAAGIETFTLNGIQAQKIGHYKAPKTVYQLSVSKSGRYLMCSGGSVTLHMLDVSDPDHVKNCYSFHVKHLLYGSNFATNYLNDGTMLLFCHGDGLIYTNPDAGDTAFHVIKYTRKIGFCGYCVSEGIETDGERIFYANKNAYSLLSVQHNDPTDIGTVPTYGGDIRFRGLLTIQNGLMIAAQRNKGMIYAIDVSNVEKPRVTTAISTNASPAKAIFVGERILMPGGRNGLLELIL